MIESHMIYEREISLGDEIEIISWLLAVVQKRLHFFHEIHNLTRKHLSACAEQVDIHVDLEKRSASELPANLYLSLQQVVRKALQHPPPKGLGSRLHPPSNTWLTTG